MAHQLKLIMNLVALLALLAAPAQATMVVDTGYQSTNVGIEQNFYYAGKFHIDQEYLISRVQGYLLYQSGATTLTAAILNDAGSTPGTTTIWSQNFTATSTAGWQGPSALSWYLPAGDYWVSIEVLSGSTFVGRQYFPATALAQNAIHRLSPPGWGLDSAGKSFQVEGTPVPLPPTVWLLGAGLLGLGVRRFRRR